MRRTAFLAILLLAGCLDDPPAAEPRDEGRLGRGSDGDGGVHHYEESFTLAVNPSTVVVIVDGVSDNCVLFFGAGYVLSNGTATLEWDAATPLAERLSIDVLGASEPTSAPAGTSPVTLAFDRLEAAGWGLGFTAAYDVAVPVAQAATMTLEFDYTGDLPGAGVGSC
jgi:hypothetical protein